MLQLIPSQPSPSVDHPFILTDRAPTVYLTGTLFEPDVEMLFTGFSLGSSPAFRCLINRDAGSHGGCIGYDLTELLDLEFESWESRAGLGVIKPMSNIDYPHLLAFLQCRARGQIVGLGRNRAAR